MSSARCSARGAVALFAVLVLAACGVESPLQPTPVPEARASLQSDGSVVAMAPPQPKVTLCHKGETITVAQPAVQAHLDHGDTLGACGPAPSPTPTASPSPSPSPSASPGTTCSGFGPGYWANWRNHYTEAQFNTLLLGTIALNTLEANVFLTSVGCDGLDSLACLRRSLLVAQLNVNLAMHPELPNAQGATLAPSCSSPGVAGSLGDWILKAQTILANPDAYTREEILMTRNALASFLGES